MIQPPFLPPKTDETFDQKLSDYLRRLAEQANRNEMRVGTTAERPLDPRQFQRYGDTDLGKMIVYVGSAWVNLDGTSL